MNVSSSTPDFNRLARPYRWLEYLSFGPFLSRARRHFLPQLAHSRHALILGDGDGRFTASLLRANPAVRIEAVDASPVMLQALERRCAAHRKRLTTHHADARNWQPATEAGYDLIATHFFLDCLTTAEVANLAERLLRIATPDVQWIVSDFGIPDSPFGRLFAAPLVAVLYRAFRLLTGLKPQALPDHRFALTAAGWTLYAESLHLHGLLVSQLWTKP
jgi:ubiquinone/menaquinone biosynthesis C-methylase UbiE